MTLVRDDVAQGPVARARYGALAAMMLIASGCGGASGEGEKSARVTPTPVPTPTAPIPYNPVALSFAFTEGLGGWEAGYADYALGQERAIGFTAQPRRLPQAVPETSGVLLSGQNVSGDLFLYLSRPVSGLRPNSRYRVNATVIVATNASKGCAIDGAVAGEQVFVKAGATDAKPAAAAVHGGYVTVNFDKGNGPTSGADAVVVGNLAQGSEGDCAGTAFRRQILQSADVAPDVVSDAEGKIWLVLGSDASGEGRSETYLLQASFALVPA